MGRPYRIYDTKTKTNLPYRCYVHFVKAHIGALIQSRWSKIGTVLEVIDVNGGAYGQYKRTLTGIEFIKLRGAKAE